MQKWLLVGVVALAFVLRIVALGSNPAGFTPDEASFGYDAYSLLRSGHDQWGVAWPLSFRSFGDFKLPLYTYLAMPSVAFFGLNETAVRLPNAIFGTLAVITTYFLVMEVFKQRRLALLCSLLLAVSPWHIPLSRGAFEANLTTLLLPLGLLLFFKAKKNSSFYVLSALVFGLNLFSYHSARLLTPVLVLFLIWERRDLLKNTKVRVAWVIFTVFVVVAAFTMFSGAGARAATSGIFNPTGGWAQALESQYKAQLVGEAPISARMFNNKIIFVASTFWESYISYFSPQFLFTQGAGEGTYGMLPGRGVLYLFEVVFILSFITALVTRKTKSVDWLIFWILLSPIPAALAKGPGFAANRTAFALPAIQIISAMGALFLYDYLVKTYKNLSPRLLSYSFFIVLLISFAFFIEGYFVSQPATQAKAMLYGVREVINSLDSTKEVVISKSISEPHIYVAFYKKIEPTLVQAQSKDWLRYEAEGRAWVDQLGAYNLGNTTFKSIDKIADFNRQNTEIVTLPGEVGELSPSKIIYYPDKTPAYFIYSTTQEFALK